MPGSYNRQQFPVLCIHRTSLGQLVDLRQFFDFGRLVRILRFWLMYADFQILIDYCRFLDFG